MVRYSRAGLSPPPPPTTAQPCTPTSTSPACGAGWKCNSQYYSVIVQYEARLHADKLARLVRSHSRPSLPPSLPSPPSFPPPSPSLGCSGAVAPAPLVALVGEVCVA